MPRPPRSQTPKGYDLIVAKDNAEERSKAAENLAKLRATRPLKPPSKKVKP